MKILHLMRTLSFCCFTLVTNISHAILLGAAHKGPDRSSTLYEIDPLTGVAAPIRLIGFKRCSGRDFDALGALYAAWFKKLLFVFLTSTLGFQAYAANFTFSGSIAIIEVDDGTGRYSGTSVGDTFSGLVVFGDQTSDAVSSDVSINRAEYGFNGSVYRETITNGLESTISTKPTIGIDNNAPISQGEADLLNTLFGTSIIGGTLFDSMWAGGVTDGAFFDANDVFKNGIEFGVALFFNTSIYSDVGLKTSPPPFASIDHNFFWVIEADSLGNEKFRAIGTIDNISVAPIPSCNFQMTQATYTGGDTVTADTFRFANLSSVPIATELKIWLGVPGVPPVSVSNVGADGSVVFPAGMDINSGPIPLFPVTGLPPGSYELSCRMLDPVTGELQWEDLNFFDIQ